MDIRNKISAIYSLEQLSIGNTIIHSLHPLVKLITTFVFIITVISFDRHDFVRLVPFIFYPTILISLSEIPYSMLLKRVLIALPFCLFIGISNLVFEQESAFKIGNITVSFGVLSFVVILYRAYLCVMALLLLAGVTRFTELTAQLQRVKIPHIFIIMFEMTYRYIAVLFSEAASMRMAYVLRSPGARGVEIRHAGTFIGNLLLRSFDRAERIHSAMKCRGYMIKKITLNNKKLRMTDTIYCALICSFCLLFRFVDVANWITSLVERVL
ncbi:MAG: cobalt ECF transporter T component CbiQ [Spirochaetaceae bacterium]|nr:cobalt ECF transporter T component CbiQ [Spirochaetaceae bacterium]